MFSFTLDIYCTSVRPGRGIPHMWLSLRFLLSFYLLKGFFSSFSLLLLRVKGRGCHTLLKPYETNCGLWIWAIQIKFDWWLKKQYNWNRSWEVLPVWHDCDDCGLTSAPSPALWFHDDSAVSDSNAHQCISMHFNVFIEWKSPEWLFSYFEGPY